MRMKAELDGTKRYNPDHNLHNRRKKITLKTENQMKKPAISSIDDEVPNAWTKNIKRFVELKTFNIHQATSHFRNANNTKLLNHAFAAIKSVKEVYLTVINEAFLFKAEFHASNAPIKYKVRAFIHTNGKVLQSICECTAGNIKPCKHIGSLLHYINYLVEIQEEKIPDDATCTSLPNNPTQPKLQSENTDDVQNSPHTSKIINQFEKNEAKRPEETVVNEIPTGIDVITNKFSQIKLWENETDYYDKEIKISEVERIEIEISTRGQSSCPAWFLQRKPRLSSTDGKRLCSMRASTNPKTFMKAKWNPTFHGNAATNYGIKYEPVALTEYVTKHQNISLDNANPGLFVHAVDNWLCASPDGLVIDEVDGPGLVEIKCPFRLQNSTIQTLLNEKKDLCLKETSQGFELKRNHTYFYQVQIAMYVTQRKWCDFVVWSHHEMFVERIKLDEKFVKCCVDHMRMFYFEKYLPYIFEKKIKK